MLTFRHRVLAKHAFYRITQAIPLNFSNQSKAMLTNSVQKFRLFCRFRLLLTAFLASFYCTTLSATQAALLDKATQEINLTPTVEIYRDTTGQLRLSDILTPSIQAQFISSTVSAQQKINFGFTSDTYWLKFTVARTTDAPSDWMLEIPYLSLNHIEFYAPGEPTVLVGTELSAKSKPIFYPLYALPLRVTEHAQSFYLRVRSDYALSIPLTLWSRTAFSREFSNTLLSQALYFGGLLSLALYNFLLFLSLRERSYLIYTGFALAMGLGMFAGNGYGRLYFWPDAPSWDSIAQTTFFGITGALSLTFAASFLQTKQRTPRLHQMLCLLGLIYLIAVIILVSSLWLDISPSLGFKLVLLTTLPATLCTLTAAAKALRAGNQSALYFLMATGSLWIGAAVAALRAFDLIVSNAVTMYALQIGSCVEMLLLSFALAHRIHTERDQRINAQHAALEARNELLAISQENEAILERKVKDRTKILQQLALNEKEIREQYVRFGAMISHEFRNPLGIIETQATLVQREVPLGINRTEERTETILSATHRLARLFDQWLKSDQLQQPIADIHKNSTIALSDLIEPVMAVSRGMHRDHRFEVDVVPALQLTGDAALLEIALLNLMDNACKYSDDSTPVRITFTTDENMVGISVTDEGPGIPHAEQLTIFQPYTRVTKQCPQSGYGLGLAFVSHIAELHQGSIKLISHSGKGSQFTLWLPLVSI